MSIKDLNQIDWDSRFPLSYCSFVIGENIAGSLQKFTWLQNEVTGSYQ